MRPPARRVKRCRVPRSLVRTYVATFEGSIRTHCVQLNVSHRRACRRCVIDARLLLARTVSDSPSLFAVFTAALAADDQTAVAVAAIKALTSVIVASKSETIMGLEIELSRAADCLRRCNPTSISLSAGCELFMRCVRWCPACGGEALRCLRAASREASASRADLCGLLL
jgi:Initiation factor 2 subunit family